MVNIMRALTVGFKTMDANAAKAPPTEMQAPPIAAPIEGGSGAGAC